MIVFPYARQHQIGLEEFIASWIAVSTQFSQSREKKGHNTMPILTKNEVLSAMIDKNYVYSLDFMCRILVSPHRHNTSQCRKIFFYENSLYIGKSRTENPVTGRTVNGAFLTEESLLILKGMNTESINSGVQRFMTKKKSAISLIENKRNLKRLLQTSTISS